MKKVGRPLKEPTQVIRVPVNRLKEVETLLGRSLAVNQTPTVMIRVPSDQVNIIRGLLKK